MADANVTSGARTSAIDHLAYPHIIERLLHFADARTLLAFSRTCHAHRSCSALATRHLVAEMRGHSLSLRSSRGPIGRELLPETHHIRARAHILNMSSCCTHTRVLDFVGPTGRNAPRPLHLIPASVVRVIDRGGISKHNFANFPSRTTVVFGDLGLRVDYDLAVYWTGPGVPPRTRLVWNVRGIGEGRAVKNKLTEKELREVVLHFAAFRGTLPLATFTQFMRVLIQLGEGELTVRLVGFDTVPLEALGFDEPPSSAGEARRKIQDELGVFADGALFTTSEEYEAEVGKAQYELETCEDLW